MGDATTVRCKFTCQSKKQYVGWGTNKTLYEYEFTAVTTGSDENKAFFAATPSGSLKVSTVTDDRFIVGAEYYIDLVPAMVPA